MLVNFLDKTFEARLHSFLIFWWFLETGLWQAGLELDV